MPHLPDADRKHLEETRSGLEKKRQSWVSSAQEVAHQIHPHFDRYLSTTNRNKGDISFTHIVDNTASQASEIWRDGLMSAVTNPSQPWFILTHPDPRIAEQREVKTWLHGATRTQLGIYARSNLYNILPPVWQQFGVFGTGCGFVAEDDEDVIRVHNFAPGEYFIAQDHKGKTDTLYRDFSMTVGQVVRKFGLENVSQKVRDMWDHDNTSEYVEITHSIEPLGKKLVTDSLLPVGAKFRSIYWERGNNKDGFLRGGGFLEFPAFVPRLDVVSTNTYGYGRGHISLGDIKQLQHQTKVKMNAIEKMADPPLKKPSTLGFSAVDSRAGHTTIYDASFGDKGIGPLYEVNFDVRGVLEDIEQIRNRINASFHVDAFTMITQLDRANITAREIDERREEKLLLLGSVLQQINDEALDPLTDRVFAIAERRGLFEEPPEQLKGQKLRVEYLSIMAQAQKATGLASMDRLAGAIGNLAQVTGSQDPLDKLDVDQWINDYADALGTPPDQVIPDDQAQSAREARANQQRLMAGAGLADKVAGAAKDLADIPLDDQNNVLAGLANAVSGASR